MNLLGYANRVNKITSNTGHMLDLIFSENDSDLISGVVVDDVCVISPVHMTINFKISIMRNSKLKENFRFRNKRNLNKEELLRKVIDEIQSKAMDLCEHGRENFRYNDCYISMFKISAKHIYENECPEVEKEIVVKDNAPWFDYELVLAKREKRRREKRWRRDKSDESKAEYCRAKNSLNS